MSQSLYIAASGALVQQMRLEVLANNLSNSNTAGFKEDKSIFRAYLPGSSAPSINNSEEFVNGGEQRIETSALSGNFCVTFEGTKTNFSPGQLKYTGNALDLALNGSGFFCVATPAGIQYTRNGNFTLNKEGVLVTQEGLPVVGSRGDIRIGNQDFIVDGKGAVIVDKNQIDGIKIVDFPQPNSLQKIGDTLFKPIDPTNTGKEAEESEIMQGFIEFSNVDSIKVITEMIEVLRAYESYQKVIQSVDDVTSKAINEVGKVT